MAKVSVTVGAPRARDQVVVGVFLGRAPRDTNRSKSVPRGFAKALAEAQRSGAFRGEAGETALAFDSSGTGRGPSWLLGLGSVGKLTVHSLRKAATLLARRNAKAGGGALSLDLGVLGAERLSRLGPERVGKAIAIGWYLGSYAFDVHKTQQKRPRRASELRISLGVESGSVPRPSDRRRFQAGVVRGSRVGECVSFVRDLANAPPNLMDPLRLAKEALKLRRVGLEVEVLGKKRLEALGMGALLAVAQGSDRPPCLIRLVHEPKGKPRGKAASRPIVLVGKAVTFDAGGLSIKPAKSMEDMKFDMSGGAAVIGALRLAAELDLPVKVVGLVPASENVIGGSAMRPGDIIRAASGKTVEIVNTDAEGRLLLADALHHASNFRPAALIDLATLTGACVVALGTEYSGIFSNDDDIERRLREAGELSGERLWRLPVGSAYLEATKSPVADLKNSGGRDGGASTAAAFLEAFVGKTPWAHLDIAGTANVERDKDGIVAGATGVGVRLLEEFLSAWTR